MVGKGLSIIGRRCYAYSGTIANSTSATTQLLFTTLASSISAQISFMGTVSPTTETGGGVTIFAVSFNSQIVGYVKTEGNEETMPNTFTVPFFIPP